MIKYICDLINFTQEDSTSPDPKEIGMVGYYHDKVADTSVLVSVRDNTVFITFRATKTLLNALEDLAEYPKAKMPPFKYHLGFYLCYAALKDELLPVLKTLNCKQIVVSGHSLGAAMACICSIELTLMGYNVKEINLMGCPAWGNRAAVKFLEERVYVINSYLNANDAIWWVAPFCHRHKFTRIGKFCWWKMFSIRDHFTEDKDGALGYFSNLKTYFGKDFV